MCACVHAMQPMEAGQLTALKAMAEDDATFAALLIERL
eukprot:COSAG01_NODE_6396_length_3689_cov_1.935376_7_plen_38_part_00